MDVIYNINEPYFCLHAEHADRMVAGCIWTIEAEIILADGKLRYGVRVSYTHPAGLDQPHPEFGVPRFVKRISKKVGIVDAREIGSSAWKISDDWHYVLRRLGEGKIVPEKLITHRLSLKNLEKGLVMMRDKTEDYCKVMGINCE